MYAGALPYNALKVSSSILKSTRCATFSQWRSAKAGDNSLVIQIEGHYNSQAYIVLMSQLSLWLLHE